MDYLKIANEVFSNEINGIKQVQTQLGPDFNQAVDLIINSKGRLVVTGMGKSGLVGKKIVATLASTGTRSFFMHPGEAYHGDLGMIHEHDVVLAISNSGESEEVVKLLSFFKDNGNKIIAMAGRAQSTLVKHSDLHLDIKIEKEACPLELAPTTSTTVTMIMGDALAVALMQARGFKAENFARFHPGGSLGRKLLTKVSDLMKKEDLPVVNPETDFDGILNIISQGRLGIGVILENDTLKGVITDGDIRRALKEKKSEALNMTAKDFGYKTPYTVQAGDKIVVAEELMQEKKISTLIVLEGEKFVGVLQRYDI